MHRAAQAPLLVRTRPSAAPSTPNARPFIQSTLGPPRAELPNGNVNRKTLNTATHTVHIAMRFLRWHIHAGVRVGALSAVCRPHVIKLVLAPRGRPTDQTHVAASLSLSLSLSLSINQIKPACSMPPCAPSNAPPRPPCPRPPNRRSGGSAWRLQPPAR